MSGSSGLSILKVSYISLLRSRFGEKNNKSVAFLSSFFSCLSFFQRISHILRCISALKMAEFPLLNDGISSLHSPSVFSLPSFFSSSFLSFLPTEECFICHRQNTHEIKGRAGNMPPTKWEQATSVTSRKHSLHLFVICLLLAFSRLQVINSLMHLCLSWKSGKI